MKYLLIYVMSIMLFLSACDNTNANADNEDNNQEMTREEFEEQNSPGMADEPTEDRDFSTATEDVMEFVKDNDKDIYVDEAHDYQIIAKYEANAVNDDGLTFVNDKGFEKRFTVFLVENEFGDKMLSYGGEHKNTTDHEVEDFGGITFVTDTGEQVYNESGVFVENDLIDTYAPGVERIDITFVELEKQDEIPQEITITLPELYKDGETEPSLYKNKEYTLTIEE